MNLNNFNEAGKKIGDELNKRRKSINAPRIPYEPSEGIIIPGEKLADYAARNKDNPIFIQGEFRMIYIKDNSFHSQEQHTNDINSNPDHCFVSGSRVHFYYCTTLRRMNNEGRNARYRGTSKIENTRIIDLNDKEDLRTRLPWCKHCIKILHRKERKLRISYNLDKIAKGGDAKELMGRVKAHSSAIQIMIEFVKGLKGVISPTRYPRYWREISKDYREQQKYKCETCRVNCSTHPNLTDAHHKDGDKTNCSSKNLECLCKYHHTKKAFHGHYKIKEEDLQTLRNLWEEQNTPHDLRG